MSNTYDDLAARAERGELAVKPGTIRQGPRASADARNLLLETTGATTIDELTKMALGRPTVGDDRGESPVVRTRVSRTLKDCLAAIAKRDGRKESEVIREALAEYVQHRGAA